MTDNICAPDAIRPELLVIMSQVQEFCDARLPGHDGGFIKLRLPPGMSICLRLQRHVPRPDELQALMPRMLAQTQAVQMSLLERKLTVQSVRATPALAD